jgi:NADH-quinone oxidoreductase subunit N
VVLVFAGFAFKISAVPFHFWAPDVYAGAPAAVGGFLAVASKAAGFAALVRVLSASGMSVPAVAEGLGPLLPDGVLPATIAAAAVATMTVGNLGALRQREIKRLLAWSSIAHAGYILLALAVWSQQGVSALVYYLVAYLFMNLAAFLMAGIVIREEGTGDLKALTGMGRRSMGLALAFAVVLFSLTGLPPFLGFVAKYQVFRAVLEKGYVWLALIGLLNGVVSLYYYARIIAYMYLDDSAEDGQPATAPRRLGFAGIDRALCVALVAPVVVFGVWVSNLWQWADHVGRSFFGAGR